MISYPLWYLTFRLTFNTDMNQPVFSEFLILYMRLETQVASSFFCTGTTHTTLQGDVETLTLCVLQPTPLQKADFVHYNKVS